MDLQGVYIRQHQQRTSPDRHIAYAVEVHGRSRTWTVWRRYSEFEALVADLEREKLPFKGEKVSNGSSSSSSSFKLPQLPPKRAGLGSTILGSVPGLRSLSGTAANGQDEAFLRERQTGLERFLRLIVGAADDSGQAYRNSHAFKAFLEIPSTNINGMSNPNTRTDFTSVSWLEEYQALEGVAKDIQAALSRREALADKGDSTASHQASVDAKKLLASLVNRLTILARGLDDVAKNPNGAQALSEGELRRRADMMVRLQDRTEVLGKLAASVSTSQRAARGPNGIPPSNVTKQALLGTASPTSSKPVTRVLGSRQPNKPVEETAQTRVLDNMGLLQLQQQEMDQQDDRLGSLTAVLRRQRELATAINVELAEHNELLDGLSQDVDRTEGKLANAKKQMRKLDGK